MKIKNVFYTILLGSILQGCNQESNNIRTSEVHPDLKLNAVDSVLTINTFKSKSKMLNNTSILIEMQIPDDQAQYFRRRGYIIDFSIYTIRNLINGIDYVKVREFVINKNNHKTELLDSLSYDKSKLSIIKEWEKNDPLSFKLMGEMLKLNNKKYDELSSIGVFIADSLSEGEFKKEFYPDFTFFLDNYINEMYGDIKGTKYRKYMEYFYYYAHDTPSLNYLKPEDVKPFLDYGDSNYYLKSYPKEVEKIKRIRREIPKEWSSAIKTI